jgi:hypothetical protein
MPIVVCCTAKTERQAWRIRKELQRLGYDEYFEERIDMEELLISVRLRSSAEKALVLETLQAARVVEISTWEELAA